MLAWLCYLPCNFIGVYVALHLYCLCPDILALHVLSVNGFLTSEILLGIGWYNLILLPYTIVHFCCKVLWVTANPGWCTTLCYKHTMKESYGRWKRENNNAHYCFAQAGLKRLSRTPSRHLVFGVRTQFGLTGKFSLHQQRTQCWAIVSQSKCYYLKTT